MEAVYVDPVVSCGEKPLVPLGVLRAFAGRWSSGRVRVVLWELFLLAGRGGLGEEQQGSAVTVTAEEMASLLDQLMAVSDALEALYGGGGAPYSHDGRDPWPLVICPPE